MDVDKLSNRICPPQMSIEEWQVALRRKMAKKSDFLIKHLDDNKVWGDYLVLHGDNKYKVAFRGVCSTANYCSCLDFRTSGLGTCKHIEAVILKLRREESGFPWGNIEYVPLYSSIYINYKEGRKVQFSLGLTEKALYQSFQRKYFDENNTLKREYYDHIDEICAEASEIDANFRCYEDVYEYVDTQVRTDKWRNMLIKHFPEKLVTTPYAITSQSQEYLEEMYQLLYIGHGILVGDATPSLYMEILAMIDVSLRMDESPALIIASSVHKLELWQSLLKRSPLANSGRVVLVSKEKFRYSTHLPSGKFSLVFVEQADYLKDWNNPISKCIKKLTIHHIYLQLPELAHLSPVQFSSIIQHISPFILAPFYQFIRKYKDIFPLSESQNNFPEKSKDYLFIRQKTRYIDWAAGELRSIEEKPEKEVGTFLLKAIELLQSEKHRNVLLRELKKIIDSL